MTAPVIIIGMHRSGTSMISDILQHLGVFMGADLEYHSESRFFSRLNGWMFYQAGATWDNPYNFKFITDNIRF